MKHGNQTPAASDHHIVPRRHARFTRVVLAASITLTMAIAAVACGADSDSGAPATELSPEAANGRQLSQSKGCAGCHGQDFNGGAGPGWIGLAGSEVQLVDGTTVTADEAYLTRAIVDPAADLVDGYTLKMPANNLSDAEVADIVAFITSLAEPTDAE